MTDSGAWTLIIRLVWMARTTVVASTSAPPATCATVLKIIAASGCTAS